MVMDDKNKQAKVMVAALDTYEDREVERGGLWKRTGSADAMHHMRSKVERVVAAHERGHFAEDDAIDLINYTCFYVRHERSQRNGEEL